MNNILVTESQLGGEGLFSAGSEGWINGAGIITDIHNFSEELGNDGLVGEFVAGAGILASGVSMAFNPIATGTGWAISYLMEHITPIREALQWVTGDRDEIAAGAQTWGNISQQLAVSAEEVQTAALQTSEESGESATAYRAKLGQHSQALTALSASAAGVAKNVNMIGVVVSAAYETIRDMIAEAIGLFLQTILEEVFTLGLATPVVAAQISAWVADKAMKVKKLLDAVMNLISKCGGIGRGLASGIRGLGRLFDLPSDLAVAAGRSVGRSLADKTDIGSSFLHNASNSTRAAGNAAELADNASELVNNGADAMRGLDETLLDKTPRRADIKAVLQRTDAQTRLDWLQSLPPARRHEFLNDVMTNADRRRMFLTGLTGQEQAQLISGLPSSHRDAWSSTHRGMLDASPQTPEELAERLANPPGDKRKRYYQLVDDNWRFPSSEAAGALEEYLGNLATWAGIAEDEWNAHEGK